MSTFSRILIKNIIFVIIIGICYLSFSFYNLNRFISEAQQSHQMVLNKITEHYQGDDLKNFSRQLRSAFGYDDLKITNFNRDIIYSYQNPDPVFSLLSITNDLSTNTYKNKNLGIYIQYRLNHDELYSLYYTISSFILVVALLIVFIGSLLTSKITTRSNRKVSKNISNLIAKEIKSSIENKDLEPGLHLPTEFSDVNNILSELKVFIGNKMQKTEQLQLTAYMDHLTGLNNRSGFVDYFDLYTKKHNKNALGVFIITRCSELTTINQVHGYQVGDDYLCQVSKLLKNQISQYDGGEIFRLNGSDFATFLPNISIASAQKFATDLTAAFNDYQAQVEFDSIGYSGIVKLDVERPLGELLGLADTAISIAQTRMKNSWYLQNDAAMVANNHSSLGNQHWSKEINYVVENQSVSLLTQLIHPSSRNNKIYHEVLSRFTGSEGSILPTGPFIAMAEKLDKIILIDRLVIEKTISEIKKKNLSTQSFGINLSTRSILDEHFVIWLERRLLKDHEVATRLIFEITEFGLEQNINGSEKFIDMVHRVGARICVEHFGVGITSFKFFRDLSPDYIKMDSTYTHNIQNDKNNQYFLRLMIDLAHRIGIKVIAESVENQEEKYAFEEIFMDGCQGYYLGKPEPL